MFVARGRVWEKDVLVNKRTAVVVLDAAIEAPGETEHLDEMSIPERNLTEDYIPMFQSFNRFAPFESLPMPTPHVVNKTKRLSFEYIQVFYAFHVPVFRDEHVAQTRPSRPPLSSGCRQG